MKGKGLLKILVILGVISALIAGTLVPLAAATSQNVTVTATPRYLAITNTPSTWTINDLGTGSENGKGTIVENTTYYANPVNGADDTTPPSATVQAAECLFDLTNSSTVNVDIVVNWGDFSGGDANMTNSDAGTNGASSYGAYCWYAGMSYASKVIVKTTGSDDMVTDTATGAFDWGVEILTQTGSWAGSSSSTSTLTIQINTA